MFWEVRISGWDVEEGGDGRPFGFDPWLGQMHKPVPQPVKWSNDIDLTLGNALRFMNKNA